MKKVYLLHRKRRGHNYLMHEGIKGMKWYQRRFQNYDGTLTEAGKLRYGKYTMPMNTILANITRDNPRSMQLLRKFDTNPYDPTGGHALSTDRKLYVYDDVSEDDRNTYQGSHASNILNNSGDDHVVLRWFTPKRELNIPDLEEVGQQLVEEIYDDPDGFVAYGLNVFNENLKKYAARGIINGRGKAALWNGVYDRNTPEDVVKDQGVRNLFGIMMNGHDTDARVGASAYINRMTKKGWDAVRDYNDKDTFNTAKSSLIVFDAAENLEPDPELFRIGRDKVNAILNKLKNSGGYQMNFNHPLRDD